ncbi:hypothetical protein [Phyllobacterium endophyticum]|uniref:hypothetical protein n=1 Tax=Phyllobacterium endophyticum TaxID=1149773 RepID=UPI001650D19B|nr:hypothetical protein [Phyllobacterium endophyticum]
MAMRVFISACVAILLIAVAAAVVLDFGFQESTSTAFSSYGVREPEPGGANE